MNRGIEKARVGCFTSLWVYRLLNASETCIGYVELVSRRSATDFGGPACEPWISYESWGASGTEGKLVVYVEPPSPCLDVLRLCVVRAS